MSINTYVPRHPPAADRWLVEELRRVAQQLADLTREVEALKARLAAASIP